MNLNLIVLFLLTLCLSSCYNEFEPELKSSNQELVLIGELEAGKSDVQLYVSTTFELNSAPIALPDFPSTHIKVHNSKDGQEIPDEFRPDNLDESLYKTPSGLVPEVGVTYFIEFATDVLNMATLKGQTTVPAPGNFGSQSDAVLVTNASGFNEIKSTVSVEATPVSGTYYHLIPYVKTSQVDSVFLDVVNAQDGQNASFILSHRDGILIDTEEVLDEISISLTLRSLNDLNINSLSDKQVYYKLKTVTDDYFHYHTSISRQNTTNQSPFTIPVLSYTQFENGYGLFAGTSSKTTSIPIE